MSILQLDDLTIQHAAGTRKRVKGADTAFNHGGALGPINRRFVLFNLVGVGDAFSRLLDWPEPATRCDLKGFNHQTPAQCGQFVMQGWGGVMRCNVLFFYQQHVARVQPGVHLHDGDACDSIARLNGTVNRRCTAPAGQQRCVNIKTTEFLGPHAFGFAALREGFV